MKKKTFPHLLPSGLSDLMPPLAMLEDELLGLIKTQFKAFGYQRIKPPLMEFEQSINISDNRTNTQKTFQVMDPISHDMMALRADMTQQISRIATQRLSDVSRPLRLCYDGEVLRANGSQLRPERQFLQVGAECIGDESAYSDVEIITLLAHILEEVFQGKLTVIVDFSLPKLVDNILAHISDADKCTAAKQALIRRDANILAGLKTDETDFLHQLCLIGGDVKQALPKIEKLSIPDYAKSDFIHLQNVCDLLQARLPKLNLTLDSLERQGFYYQSGLSFTIYAKNITSVLGRGGRYIAGRKGEAAVGFSFYMDTVLKSYMDIMGPLCTIHDNKKSIYAPCTSNYEQLKKLRNDGYSVTESLHIRDDKEQLIQAARAQKIACILWDGDIVTIE